MLGAGWRMILGAGGMAIWLLARSACAAAPEETLRIEGGLIAVPAAGLAV